MIKLSFYVPETHLEEVKQAVFAAGAGTMGDYDQCAWQVLGQGQFRPLEDSDPYIGRRGVLQYVPEYRVELVCDPARIHAAVSALKAAHPYEEPAYEACSLLDI